MPVFNVFVNSFIALTISIILSYLTIFTIALEPQYVYHSCGNNSTNFSSNSSYESNLKSLLKNLLEHATTKKFYQIPENFVHGSYLCRGDINGDVCHDCVETAEKSATEINCPLKKEVVIWYDLCMLRYANRSFSSALETDPAVYLWNFQEWNASERRQFRTALSNVLSDFAAQVEHGAESFLTKAININSGSKTMYSLMQCTPDLSGSDCTKCLNYTIEKLPECCVGGRVLCPSCNIRFEVSGFYNDSTKNQIDPVVPTTVPSMPTDGSPAPPGNGWRISGAAVAAIVIAVIVASVALGCFVLRYRRHKKRKQYDVVRQENGVDSLQYELITIETATKNFSQDYKLGEGGFGEVYKGIFASGQEIAVKRLSKSSGQGTEEFKNEVALVAKLQHRNLVRLLGFCLGGGETLLVYEFVPNKSLDYLLFDPEKRGLLDWSTRSKIIGGICRGILYLHEDSRLRVIHRDLKASNVLLDEDMNPKISDFGMARMVGVDQTQGNTKRIVGTYGYMAPEYAMEGLYSVKSDVFSFGVLLLEILSGKKNSGFHLTKSAPSLLAFAWQLWNEGRGMELMDEILRDSCPPNEFLRYIHIGLLCVQEDAYNRPTMSAVVLMLTSESTSLPKPERPAFSVGRFAHDSHQVLGAEGCSDNGLTISHFSPR